MTRKRNPSHGWTNDETWTVASVIENNEALHETTVNEASLAMTKALAGGAKTQRDLSTAATADLARALRKRFEAAHDRVTSSVYTMFRNTKVGRDELDIAGALLMLARVAVDKTNWKEVAGHYVSGFQG